MTEPNEYREQGARPHDGGHDHDGEHHDHDGELHDHEHHGVTEALAERPGLAAILFDLRSVIGLLFVVYGVILTVLGLIGESQADLDKSGGIALNLWVGLAMLVGGIIFFTWAFTKPPMPPTRDEMAEIDEGGPLHMGGH